MPPLKPTPWEPSTTIELLALFLTIPGALAALATLWIVFSHRRRRERMSINFQTVYAPLSSNLLPGLNHIPITEDSTHTSLAPGLSGASEDTVGDNGSFIWFQEQYDNLHGEVAAEREEWVEMADRQEGS